jgi:hypothetical protein
MREKLVIKVKEINLKNEVKKYELLFTDVDDFLNELDCLKSNLLTPLPANEK